MKQTYFEKTVNWLVICLGSLAISIFFYNSLGSVVFDIIYLIDGYDVEAYITYSNFITDRKYEQEIVDIKGKHYKLIGVLGKKNIKVAQEANATGQKVIIRRSKLLDKWNFWEKGELTGKVVFKDFLIIFVVWVLVWAIYSDIKKKFNTKKTPPAG